MESNHHGVAPASPSSWCVYQFRHHRKQRALKVHTICYFFKAALIQKRVVFLSHLAHAIKCKCYFFGRTGAAGAAGAGTAVGAAAGACCAGTAAEGLLLRDMIEDEDGFPEI